MLAGVAVAIGARGFCCRAPPAPFILPGVLFAAVAVTHIVVRITRLVARRSQGRRAGPFHLQPAAACLPVAGSRRFASSPGLRCRGSAATCSAVMFVTTISLLLNATGVEIATKREANIERELNALGIASLCSSALGGFVSCSRSAAPRSITQPARPAACRASRSR